MRRIANKSRFMAFFVKAFGGTLAVAGVEDQLENASGGAVRSTL